MTLGLDGAGGLPGGTYIVTATTDLTLPLATWTPISTNTFGTFGEINVPNFVNFDMLHQFFRIIQR